MEMWCIILLILKGRLVSSHVKSWYNIFMSTTKAVTVRGESPNTRFIELAQGKGRALIDEMDFSMVGKHRWWYNGGTKGYGSYAVTMIGGKKVYMHRLVASPGKGEHVDHKNGNKLDNRRSNLRLCSRSQNLANQKMKSTNTSGFIGVSLSTFRSGRTRWCAKVYKDGRSIHLGYFDSKEEAARARDASAKRVHGEFAHLNFK